MPGQQVDLEEIDRAFPGNLHKILTEHFVGETSPK